MKLRADGTVMQARLAPSPNCDERPAGTAISLLVLHGISLPPGVFGGDAIEQLFTNRLDPAADPYYADLSGLRVSSHFLVRRDGSLVQFVPVGLRAWQAGVSAWRARERCNDWSVGVELEGADTLPYAGEQYVTLAALSRLLMRALPITACAGHSDVAPGRKTDPGAAFDWPLFLTLLIED